MILKYLSIPLIVVVFIILINGCSKKEEPTPEAPFRRGDTSISPTVSSVAGIAWSLPSHWRVEAERPMRVATYSTPSAEGDTDRGEVAVFYFGPREGGDVEANINRWLGQFEQPDGHPTKEVATIETKETNDLRVSIVKTTGTYTAAAGPMAPRQDIRPRYKLIGAIVEGPQGAVFFKFTGPEKTVRVGEENFISFIQSIHRF